MRVVSLVPSSTETLLDLDANVIACSKFCEQPDIAHVGGTKNPDIAAIVALAPDVVVLDREENRREDAESLEAAGIDLFVSEVTDLAGALRVVTDLAELIGASSARRELPMVKPIGCSVFVPIWRRPWMSISEATYGGALLSHLGCRLVTADAADPYPEISLDQIAAPDVVAVPSEPYDFTDEHLAELQRAFPASVVVRVDGQDLFWWGSRTPDAVTRVHRSLATAARPSSGSTD